MLHRYVFVGLATSVLALFVMATCRFPPNADDFKLAAWIAVCAGPVASTVFWFSTKQYQRATSVDA
jgi:hypothetical protein